MDNFAGNAVGAIAQGMAVGDPDIAGDMAGIMMDAAMANPEMAENFVGEIAGGMAAGAPLQAGEIAVGMMEANRYGCKYCWRSCCW